MARLKRQLHYRMKGALGNDEYWTYLVFDTDANRLYVEEEWDLNDTKGHSEQGTTSHTIEEFLNQSSKGGGHRELLDLIKGLFPKDMKGA